MTDNELKEYVQKIDHLKYCVFQRERGENTGTEHIQMYLEFSKQIRFNRLKSFFPTAHIEKRKGTRKQARDYCMKEETRIGEVVEIGSFVDNQGRRSDLEDIVRMIKEGATDMEILSEYPSQYFLYNKHVAKVRELITKEKYTKEWRDVVVIYIWGDTGTGKSRYVREKHGYENIYVVNDYGSGAFDSYTNQDILILEEFRSDFTLKFLLQLLDGYPLRLPARYFDKVACFSRVYIISNIPMDEQYRNIQEKESPSWSALNRRIKYKVWFGHDYKTNLDKMQVIENLINLEKKEH